MYQKIAVVVYIAAKGPVDYLLEPIPTEPIHLTVVARPKLLSPLAQHNGHLPVVYKLQSIQGGLCVWSEPGQQPMRSLLLIHT